jgi:hypothetical protein
MLFFKPGWMSKNADKAVRAVEKLNKQADMEKAALEAPGSPARKAAVKRIENQEVLAKVALHDSDTGVQFEAIEKMTDAVALIAVMQKHKDAWAVVCIFERLCSDEIIQNADINAKDEAGNTLLHIAAKKLYPRETALKVCEKLVARGADLNAKNNAGQTPYEFVSYDFELSALLLNNTIDPCAAVDKFFWQAVETVAELPAILADRLPLKNKAAYQACAAAIELPTCWSGFPSGSIHKHEVTARLDALLKSHVPEKAIGNVLNLLAKKEDPEVVISNICGDNIKVERSYKELREQAQKLLAGRPEYDIEYYRELFE